MNNKSKMLLILAILCLGACNVFGGDLGRIQTTSLSIPELKIVNKERIIGFELHITAGTITNVSKMPLGWELCVSNDASWNSVIKGAFGVAAVALNKSFFRDFITVQRDESLEVPLDVEGEIIVTEDFHTERRIKVALKDFSVIKQREGK